LQLLDYRVQLFLARVGLEVLDALVHQRYLLAPVQSIRFAHVRSVFEKSSIEQMANLHSV
jgi:hypothetical protein